MSKTECWRKKKKKVIFISFLFLSSIYFICELCIGMRVNIVFLQLLGEVRDIFKISKVSSDIILGETSREISDIIPFPNW